MEELLLKHGIKPTAVRVLVCQMALKQTNTFTLSDMENWLPYADKSSIFRALRLFTEHHLLHSTDDGTGLQKYCVCRCQDEHHHGHVHFTCIKCGKTYCLEDMNIPHVEMPEGFDTHEVEYVAKGLCPKCR